MADRFLMSLGLVKQSGRLVRGREETAAGLAESGLKGAFIASDASERAQRDMGILCAKSGRELIKLNYTMAQLGAAVGEKPLAVFSVRDARMFQMLTTALSGGK